MEDSPSTGPVTGLPLHTRSLTVSVKPQAGGLWLARGDIIDLRKNGFVPSSYDIQPSGIIHSMNIELDLDPGSLRIEAIRVEQPFVAVEPSVATKGECCRDPAPRLLDLTGETLDRDFPKRLGDVFGGPLGCSHLLTLFQLMASAVPRAAEIEHDRFAREGTQHADGDRFFRRSVFVDGFEATKGTTDVAIQFADSVTRPYDPTTGSLDRIELSHEVKIFASVERTQTRLERLDIRERMRRADTIVSAEWQDHSGRFASLVDNPIVPGLAGRVFGIVGENASLAAVKDALLMFAPGFIQVMAAQMEDHLKEQIRAAETGEKGAPRVGTLGGMTNACYIWREGSPVHRGSSSH